MLHAGGAGSNQDTSHFKAGLCMPLAASSNAGAVKLLQ
jgi:hypothetical protein